MLLPGGLFLKMSYQTLIVRQSESVPCLEALGLSPFVVRQ